MSKRLSGRSLKKSLEHLLLQDDFTDALASVKQFPERQAINPLISFFCNRNPLLKWRAVSAAGSIVAGLADTSTEKARVIMRRLMWTLNDESGGIGWGAPEAMGDAMARSRLIAEEYNRILISYADEQGNYLEHLPLQKGLLWGIGRLSGTWPDLAAAAAPFTRPHLFSDDPENRGLAAIIAGHLNDSNARSQLYQLKEDSSVIAIYNDGFLTDHRISDLACTALGA